ncbi:Probable receptor-like protein kinase At1g33260 [Linum grandiflorum]
MAFRDGCCLPIPNFLTSRRRRRKPTGDQVVAVCDDEDDDSVAVYGWGEIERLTQNFNCLIGSGGFSNVYLADGGGGAVKVSCGGGDYLSPVFNQELDIMLRLRHPNVVRLQGYSSDQGGALVMEYASNGTLQEKLHGKSNNETLSWNRRMAIAYQLAQAIEYLHDKCDSQLPIVHGDIKASNVLLDSHLNCKLCDFGSAKMGFSSAVAAMRPRRKLVMTGSLGYTDPHYIRTGLPSKKNDIYSYGVVVLELVTGREAFSEEKSQLLASVMEPMIVEDDEDGDGVIIDAAGMVDPRLGGEFEVEEAKAMLRIAGKCIGQQQAPTMRPSATQIVEDMIVNVPSAFSSMCSSSSSGSCDVKELGNN